MTVENWRAVVGYEGFYEVSDQGTVRSVDRRDIRGRRLKGKILKERPLPNGRPRVSLSLNGESVDAYVYHLVLSAFVGPKPEGMECLHWDDNSNNNAIENLRWGTRTDNMRDMSRNGNGNAGITSCPQGHEYNSANTYVYPTGRQHRGCRECGRLRSIERNRVKRINKAA